jgi:hypothetical protein
LTFSSVCEGLVCLKTVCVAAFGCLRSGAARGPGQADRGLLTAQSRTACATASGARRLRKHPLGCSRPRSHGSR